MADRQLIRPLDVATLREQYRAAEPFPIVVVNYRIRRVVARAIGRH
jgi:hypothetical protein